MGDQQRSLPARIGVKHPEGTQVKAFGAPARRCVVGVIALGTAVAAVNAIGIVSASAAVTGTTFGYTGSIQTYTVPAGVAAVQIDAAGAQGQTGTPNSEGNPGGQGGYGARTSGGLTVQPGETLYVSVGGSGSNGGWNGGGAGGFYFSGYFGGTGGGASDVRVGGTGENNAVLVAAGGGGGGAGGWGAVPPAGAGGSGGVVGTKGGSTGIADQNVADYDLGGDGGTPTSGGSGGCDSGHNLGSGGCAANGGFGYGGAGLSLNGGGGGGGYYGGGGGAGNGGPIGSILGVPFGYGGAGGGGGASYAAPTVASPSFANAGQTGDGSVTITPISVGGVPSIGGGGVGPSASCTSGLITNSTVEGEQVWLYAQQVDAQHETVCFRVQNASTGQGYGGQLNIAVNAGIGQLGVPSLDSQATTCSTTPGNAVPGAHPIAAGTVGPVAFMFDAYANTNTAWACLIAGSVQERIVVPVQTPGVVIPSVSFSPDPGTP